MILARVLTRLNGEPGGRAVQRKDAKAEARGPLQKDPARHPGRNKSDLKNSNREKPRRQPMGPIREGSIGSAGKVQGPQQQHGKFRGENKELLREETGAKGVGPPV